MADLRLVFIVFAAVAILIGFAAASRYPGLFYKPYKGISILRIVFSGLFLLSLTYLIASVLGLAGFFIAGIILFGAGVIVFFDRPDKEIK